MRLIKRFILNDIRDYELDNNVNLMDYFSDVLDLNNLIELIKIGNRTDEKSAIGILSRYLVNPDNNLKSAYIEVRDELLGKKPEEGNEDNLETKQYDSLTDIFNELCKRAIEEVNGITYSEFWSMSTKEMYQIVDGLNKRKIEQYNEDLTKMHTMACMINQAMWGKLDKNPPQIKEKQTTNINKNEKIFVEGIGYLTQDEYKVIKLLEQQNK